MRYRIFLAVCAILLSAGVAVLADDASKALTNDSILQMMAWGFNANDIVGAIGRNATQFDLSSSAVKSLKQKGVSDDVLWAMFQASVKSADQALGVSATPARERNAPPGVKSAAEGAGAPATASAGEQAQPMRYAALTGGAAGDGAPMGHEMADLTAGGATPRGHSRGQASGGQGGAAAHPAAGQGAGQAQADAAVTPPAPLLGEALQGCSTVNGIATAGADVVVSVDGVALPKVTADDKGGFTVELPDPQTWRVGQTLTATQTVNHMTSQASPKQNVVVLWRTGLEFRAILGFQQAGASAAQASLNWFTDIYFSNPLPLGNSKAEDPRWRWWGNVRVASYPQQGNVPVSTFASNFITEFGKVNVNQLVEGGEYVTGFEFRLNNFGNKSFVGQSESTRQRFTLGFTGSIGATSPFSPATTVNIFAVPAKTSPQYARFSTTFPSAANSTYIAFVSPDRDQFFREYFFGLRMTTHFADMTDKAAMITAPALASISFGQNEQVTGGRLHGVVMRSEGFYPLPIGDRADSSTAAKMFSGIYLFGTVQLYLKRGQNISPFVLQPAPSTVNAYDSNVAQVTVPSNRDIYRIGVGIDLVSVVNGLKSAGANAGK